MQYLFHPDAETELNDAIDYYETCRKNLGVEFSYEVQRAIHRVLQFPHACQKLDKDIRRCLIHRFPFGLLYYVKDNKIIILAIMQLQRKPNYWKSRK